MIVFPPAELCVRCKGVKGLCGEPTCPILRRLQTQKRIFSEVKTEVFGPSPPNLFVGSRGYPNLSVGYLVSEESVVDDPRKMYGMDLDEIVEQRSKLFRTSVKRNVYSRDRVVQDLQDVVLSTREVDVEVKFSRVKKETYFHPLVQPMGPLGIMERYRVVGNARIPKKVESLRGEGLPVREALPELLRKGFDNYYITKVFNAGILGVDGKRRLVPTRWSITATDDLITKEYLRGVRDYPLIDSYEVYSGGYLYNSYTIILLPERWRFENFEAWAHGSLWNLRMDDGTYMTVEYEPFGGRSDYADLQGGGYYASRFAVVEHLYRRGRQAAAVVLREISAGYMVPVGVWQVRENIRNILSGRPQRFATLGEALDYVRGRVTNPLTDYVRKSRILGQTTLRAFM